MKPLPKIFGIIGAVYGVVAAAKVAFATGDWTAVGPAVAVLLTLFSHSATGSGPMLPGSKT